MFKEYISDFHESVEGLRDFVELINPFLSEHTEKVTEQHEKDLRPFELAHLRFLEQDEEKKKEYSEQLSAIFDGEIEVEYTSEPDEEGKPPKKRALSFKVKGDTTKIDAAFDKLSRTAYQKGLLYKNSLISLLSSVEWFYSQILHFYYDKFPESAGIKKKTLTLEELKSFQSVKDAESYLIEDKIEGILRGSFKDWIDILKSELALKLTYIDGFEDELLEIYQRRNILVHNGGTINSIYLSKVSEKYKLSLKIGDRVIVSEEYLERAISLLHSTFTLIACELWKKMDPEEESRCKVTMDLGYEYLKKGAWDICQKASTFLCADKKMPIASRTAAQLNFWLAKKLRGKYGEVKADVDNADFSDKAKLFQVALHSLRDEDEEFFGLLPQVLKTEELEPEEVLEFPIFENMRQKPEFAAFLEENGIMKEFLSRRQNQK